jgi:hypothetical protein
MLSGREGVLAENAEEERSESYNPLLTKCTF